MIIYRVEYNTGYDYCETIGYYLSEEEANEVCKNANKDNPGLDAYVSDIEVD